MKFVIAEKGLIPEKHKDAFDPFWGRSLFHDYFEHFFEKEFIFKDELYENLIGEISSIGSSYYFIERNIGYYKIKKINKIVYALSEEVYLISTSEYILNKYSIDFNKFKELKYTEGYYKYFKIISKITLDRITKYKPEVLKLLGNDFDYVIYKALLIGYEICKNKFENIITKNIYNLTASLERLQKKDCKWFYDNFKSAEIITNKKGRIKLKFYK